MVFSWPSWSQMWYRITFQPTRKKRGREYATPFKSATQKSWTSLPLRFHFPGLNYVNNLAVSTARKYIVFRGSHVPNSRLLILRKKRRHVEGQLTASSPFCPSSHPNIHVHPFSYTFISSLGEETTKVPSSFCIQLKVHNLCLILSPI